MTRDSAIEEKEYADDIYQVLFNSSPIAYFALSQSGIIQQVNNAAVELLGFPESDLLKRNISSIFPSAGVSHDTGKILISEVLQGKELKNVEVQMITSDGDTIWVGVTASIINRNTGGKSIGLLATNIDRRKHAEARATAERERASLVLEVMTHDLNNVNQSLIFSLGLLGESQPLNDTGSNLLISTLMEVKRASRMISNLRTIFSLSETSIQKEWTDIHTCLIDAIYAVSNEFDTKKLLLQSDIAEGIFIAEAHQLLTTVFFNILHNSMQYDPSDEVRVSVSATHTKTREKIRIVFED
ncbi:MAG: PAS domain S-box protein, partial [Candidatus Thorarchaeota archaeon]